MRAFRRYGMHAMRNSSPSRLGTSSRLPSYQPFHSFSTTPFSPSSMRPSLNKSYSSFPKIAALTTASALGAFSYFKFSSQAAPTTVPVSNPPRLSQTSSFLSSFSPTPSLPLFGQTVLASRPDDVPAEVRVQLDQNTWLVQNATPQYQHQHQHVNTVQQAAALSSNLQGLPPLRIRGRMYPSYSEYMLAEGFIPQYYRDHYPPYGAYGIAAACALVTLARNVLPDAEPWLMENMTLSYANRLKPWTYLTSSLTHFGLGHLTFNTIALISFSQSVGVVSPGAFLALFATLAVGSSIGSLAMTATTARLLLYRGLVAPGLMTPAVGASGAIAGMVSLSALTHPENNVGVIFIPGVNFNIMSALMVFIGLDTLGFLAQCRGRRTGLSHSGHLAGYFTGALIFNFASEKYNKQYMRSTYGQWSNWLENTIYPRPLQVAPSQ